MITGQILANQGRVEVLGVAPFPDHRFRRRIDDFGPGQDVTVAKAVMADVIKFEMRCCRQHNIRQG